MPTYNRSIVLAMTAPLITIEGLFLHFSWRICLCITASMIPSKVFTTRHTLNSGRSLVRVPPAWRSAQYSSWGLDVELCTLSEFEDMVCKNFAGLYTTTLRPSKLAATPPIASSALPLTTLLLLSLLSTGYSCQE